MSSIAPDHAHRRGGGLSRWRRGPHLSSTVFQARPGKFDGSEWYNSVTFCSSCRQGNTSRPLLHLVSGRPRAGRVSVAVGVMSFTLVVCHLWGVLFVPWTSPAQQWCAMLGVGDG